MSVSSVQFNNLSYIAFCIQPILITRSSYFFPIIVSPFQSTIYYFLSTIYRYSLILTFFFLSFITTIPFTGILRCRHKSPSSINQSVNGLIMQRYPLYLLRKSTTCSGLQPCKVNCFIHFFIYLVTFMVFLAK